MEIIIKLTENNQLVSINDAQFIYQKLENELGEYFDIKGEISFNDDGNSIFKFTLPMRIGMVVLVLLSSSRGSITVRSSGCIRPASWNSRLLAPWK